MNWYDLLTTDVERLTCKPPGRLGMLKVLVHPSLQAVALYRIAHACYERKLFVMAKICQGLSILLTGCDIHPAAVICEGMQIGHPTGIVVGQNVTIGPRVTIMQNVTIGKRSYRDKGMPTIGADVALGAGAAVLGPIHIGDETGIGANAVVINDVPARSTVVTEPARILRIGGSPQQSPAELKITAVRSELEVLKVEQAVLKQMIADVQIQLAANATQEH